MGPPQGALDNLGLVGILPRLRHLGEDVEGERIEAQRRQSEGRGIERAVPRVILAIEADRPAQERQHVLHRQQMPHLLLGNRQDIAAPARHRRTMRRRHLLAA
ncbi:MAG TPA: hypothetical protein VE993_06060, partial [Stellaceae bacterium]|nr:hypothetical protein [Stellaceae bacterium]